MLDPVCGILAAAVEFAIHALVQRACSIYLPIL